MRAAQIKEYGDITKLNVVDIDKPTVKAGQVLVEVHASSLNPFDTAVRAGYVQQHIPLQLPVTLGGDIAGIIVEVGKGVDNVSVGDKVYGQANVVAGNSGAFAEYAATSASQVAIAPANLDFNYAASLPLVGVSAWQAINEHIGLQTGQKILVTGGSGGIGRIAIQLAKHIGAYVATTATGDGINDAKSLGADEVIDYKVQDFTEIISGYDAVFDTVGGEEFSKSISVLKKGGVAVSMAAQVDEAKAKDLGVTALTQATHVTTEALNKLRELIESGAVKTSVGKIFKLEEIQQAFEARESGKIAGKVVLEIKP